MNLILREQPNRRWCKIRYWQINQPGSNIGTRCSWSEVNQHNHGFGIQLQIKDYLKEIIATFKAEGIRVFYFYASQIFTK
jgi:hypothetical protein